jgi:uncharacterized OB-fold protein
LQEEFQEKSKNLFFLLSSGIGGKNGRCGLVFVDERTNCASNSAEQEEVELRNFSQIAAFLRLEKSHNAAFSLLDV